MDILAGGQNKGVSDGVATWTRFHIASPQGFCEGSQLVVHDYLLQADLQVVKQSLHLFLVCLLKFSDLQEPEIRPLQEWRMTIQNPEISVGLPNSQPIKHASNLVADTLSGKEAL